MYPSSYSNPLINSTVVFVSLDCSTLTTPSCVTFFIVSAIRIPISESPFAETVATSLIFLMLLPIEL